MGGVSGLRERKKRETRELIAQTAADLFAAHGFDAVTVEDVARAAKVSRASVFNYFPTKEQMLFSRDQQVEAGLVEAVRGRLEGAALVAAFREHTHRFWTQLDPALAHRPRQHGFWEIVAGKPALRDYAEAVFARQSAGVARQLSHDRGLPPDDPVCHALSRALCGVNAAILVHGLERLIAGEPPPQVTSDALKAADRAYDLLEHGLARL